MNILLSGASGRVGREIERLAAEDHRLQIAGRASSGSSCFEQAESAEPGDVVIDFSSPEQTARALEFARSKQLPLVVGTTGIKRPLQRELESAAESIPICQAANFSIGVHVLRDLASRAAEALPESFEAEIFELHHRWKVDAPSGTALALGRAVSDARGYESTDPSIRGAGERASRSVGYQVGRGGDVVGEHQVMFLGDGERIELVHRAGDRAVFARGALHAARWLIGRAPGLYSLRDVLD